MTRTGTPGELLVDYQALVQRILDCLEAGVPGQHDRIGPRAARQIVDSLRHANGFRNRQTAQLPDEVTTRRSCTSGCDLADSVDASRRALVAGYLRRCPERLQLAAAATLVHGDTIRRMAERTGWTDRQARQFRAEALDYLSRADDVTAPRTHPSRAERPLACTLDPASPSHPPAPHVCLNATAGAQLYERADANRLNFWATEARELLWDEDFHDVLEWSCPPHGKWFVGGRLNVAVNCVDRHVAAGKGKRIALHWVGSTGERRDITYRQLERDVAKAANYLTELAMKPGDRVAICMSTIPEAVVAMLACARLGLPHLLIPTNASPKELRARLDDARPSVVITSNGHHLGGKPTPLKVLVDEALSAGGAACDSVRTVLVTRHTDDDLVANWVGGRDVWWQDTVDAASEHHTAQSFEAGHPLFLLYAADAAGRSNGIVHATGGYLTHVRHTFRYVFDYEEDTDVFWCGAELASIAGHSYGVYGPLANGATSVLVEGALDLSDPPRQLGIIEDLGVTTYYVAPTVIRALRLRGRAAGDGHDLSSLRLLATTGDQDPEAWAWCHEVTGIGRCRVANTWWQTETGAMMIAPLPGVTATVPGSPVRPLPGISAHVVDSDANLVEPGEGGTLVLDRPWPAMPLGIWGQPGLFGELYWSQFPGRGWFFTGAAAGYDDEDVVWVYGPTEDVTQACVGEGSTDGLQPAPADAVSPLLDRRRGDRRPQCCLRNPA
jgi:acetyl-CoA synthetase